MRRIFGRGQLPQPKATLSDCIATNESSLENIEKKVQKLGTEIRSLMDQAGRAQAVTVKNALKQKALRLLKQKRMYEQQAESLQTRTFNIEQMSFTHSQLKDTAAMADAMKSGVTEMKKQMKRMNIDKLENLQDDMEDLAAEAEEINQIFSRDYNLPEIDENELEAEFMALDSQLTDDASYLDEAIGVPSAPNAFSSQLEENPHPVYNKITSASTKHTS